MLEIYKNQKNNYQVTTFGVGDFGSNCTVVHNVDTKEAFVFDPGFDIGPINEFRSKNQLNITKIIHTHGHFDHLTCSSELKRQTNAKLCLHRGDEYLLSGITKHAALFGLMVEVQTEKVDEYITEESSFTLGSGGPGFTTIHTPGHSEGGCTFYTDYFDVPLMIAGDTLFQHSIGRTDLPGGNHQLLLSSIKDKLFNYPDNTLVITGHGPVTTIGDEKKYNAFLI